MAPAKYTYEYNNKTISNVINSRLTKQVENGDGGWEIKNPMTDTLLLF